MQEDRVAFMPTFSFTCMFAYITRNPTQNEYISLKAIIETVQPVFVTNGIYDQSLPSLFVRKHYAYRWMVDQNLRHLTLLD